MKKIRVLVADDEPLSSGAVTTLLGVDPQIEIVAVLADGRSAVAAIRAEKPDLVFLDVQMPGYDGFQVLSELQSTERPVVIFMTAHDRYAVKAFDFFALDYLLKPFDDARFAAALARAKKEIALTRTSELSDQVEGLLAHIRKLQSGPVAIAPAESSDRVVLKSGTDFHFVKPDDILWIEAQGDFLKVRTSDQAQLVRETLQEMERKLDPRKFLRIHRSFIVNLAHIKKVSPALYGDSTVLMSDGAKLRLSRSYRSVLKNVLT